MILPRILTAELTYRCNHSCLFCSCPWEADKSVKETELSTREWQNIFRVVKKYGVEQVTFSGGEATLRSDFSKSSMQQRHWGCRSGSFRTDAELTKPFYISFKNTIFY